MQGCTDLAFREICKRYGADVVFTEFVSSDSLIRDAKKSVNKLDINEKERPVAIQIFGNDIRTMCESAMIAEKVHPDFIDINCGCPVSKVVSKGCGAALLKNTSLLIDIVSNVVKSVDIPVTVKTRIGWDTNSIIINELVERLQDVGVQMVTIHARTRGQMYSGKADWNFIKTVKENKNIVIPIIGNGDVVSAQQAKDYFSSYGVDGIMIGRGAIGHPWIFNEIKGISIDMSLTTICNIIREHITLAQQYLNNDYFTIISLRKHYKNYFKNVPDMKTYKTQLMEANTVETLLHILDTIEHQGRHSE